MLRVFQKNKILTVLLVVSLAFNAFFVAQVIGQQARQRMMMGRLTQSQLDRLVNAVPEKKQAKLRANLEASMKTIQQDLDAIHTERQNLADLMSADKFNEDAIQRQFALLRVRMNYLQKHLQMQTLTMMRDLSPEERAKAVNMMQPPKLWRPKPPVKADVKDEKSKKSD